MNFILMNQCLLLIFLAGCTTLPEEPEIIKERAYNVHWAFQDEKTGIVNYGMQDYEITNKRAVYTNNVNRLTKEKWESTLKDFRYEELK